MRVWIRYLFVIKMEEKIERLWKEYYEMPVDFMNHAISSPDILLFWRMKSLGIVNFIEYNFSFGFEKADAYDGAFKGLHMHEDIYKSGTDSYVIDEIFQLYKYFDNMINKSPFYLSMRRTLNVTGNQGLFEKGVDYIIDKMRG